MSDSLPDITRRLVAELTGVADRRTVRHAQVGLIYSAVELTSGGLGVAFTFPQARACGEREPDDAGPLAGRPARELLERLGASSLLSSTLALATANALLAEEPLPASAVEGDVLDCIEVRPGDRVCMVGSFLPLLEPLRQRQASVTALDQVPKPGSRPAAEAERWLPHSDVAIITATSIINATIGGLLALTGSCREVAVLGSSTPLLPEAFVGTPVTCLAGIRVSEPEGVLQSIAEGQGFRAFKRYVRKVAMRLPAG